MLFFLLLILPIISRGQHDLSSKLEKYMDAQADVNRFGGSVIVMKDNKLLLRKSYGMANHEWKVPNAPDTKFVLASITKHFTAIAILQLVEQRKLSLDDKLSKFFPKYPNGDKVTIHMLLTHSSGLALDFDEIYMFETATSKDSAMVRIMKKPFHFEPGSNVKYSNIGYFLLSQIVEKASAESYSDFLQRHIFDKAGMTNTGVMNNDSIVSGLADIYYRNGKSFAKNPYINWTLNTGHDGMYSTVDDLYKLDRAMYGESIISHASQKLMNTHYNKKFPDNGFFENYGYGVFINPYYNHGRYHLTHSGGFIGTMTSYDRFPKDDVFVAVLSNNESESHMISYGLSGIVFGVPVELPYVHKSIPADDIAIKKFAGKYGPLEFIESNGKLFIKNGNLELVPESRTKFFRKDNPDRTFEFQFDKKGKVSSVIATKGGVRELHNQSTK